MFRKYNKSQLMHARAKTLVNVLVPKLLGLKKKTKN